MAKEQTAIRLDPAQKARVAELAQQEQRTVGAMIRILVGEALEAREAGGGRGRGKR
jgi:hypothetical protein